MQNLRDFIAQRNSMRRLFNKEPYQLHWLTEKQKLEILADLECALSPENLTCDGELSSEEVNKKARFLTAAKAELASLSA